jgi:ATP-binding protein involved in chromosome partitioning
MSSLAKEHEDPRLSIIPRRLSRFKQVVIVLSPKGGVGKTTVSVLLALAISKWYGKTALLDLDVTNPTTHIVLGLNIEEVGIEEDKGILPMKIPGENLEFMTIAFFTKNKLLPLRGIDIVNIVRELLSVTRWDSDILVVDSPPGFSDEILEFSKFTRKAKYLIISTPDPLSISSAQRVVELLQSEKQFIIGIVGNMCREDRDLMYLQKLSSFIGIEVLTCLPWVNEIHKHYGNYSYLFNLFGGNLLPIVNRIVSE